MRSPIDIDPGPYKTVKTDAGTSSAKWMAGAQLGAYVPQLDEIDKRIVRATFGTTPLSSLKNLGGQIDGAETVPANKKFLFGFASAGNDSDPNSKRPMSTTSLKIGVFRYTDAGAARAAITETVDAFRKETGANRKKLDLPEARLDVAPGGRDFPEGTLVITGGTSGKTVNSRVFAPHGSDILMVSVSDKTTASTTATSKRAIGLMIQRLAGSQSVTERSAMTDASFVTLTVPFRKDESRSIFEGTVAGPRTYAHIYHQSLRADQMFTTAGVDLIATRETQLFRTASKDKATGLREAFAAWGREDGSTRNVASPQDLPSAKCTESTEASSGDKSYECNLVYERYYATASSSTSLLEAQQKISAQYLILKERG